MIQRIQSIFLLVASAAFFLQFVFPFANSSDAGSNFFSDMVYNIQDHPILLVLACLGGAVAAACIFLYSNRPLQVRLSYLVVILSILLPAAAILLFLQAGNVLTDGGVEDSLGLYLPIASLVCGILAVRFIKKDDNLVRSMDRLR